MMDRKMQILEQAREAMRLRHLSPKTEKCYLGWISRYVDFLKDRRWDGQSSEQKVEAFLTQLAVRRRVGAVTQNQAFSAFLFFYGRVLKQPLREVDALRAKRGTRERASVDQGRLVEVLKAVRSTDGAPVKLICWLLYGCGLRLNEGLGLRVKDVLFAESALVIRQAKGDKDRRVPLPCALVPALKRQMAAERVVWERDAERKIRVGGLPDAIEGKYRRLGLRWQWAWVFPSPSTCLWCGEERRHHIHETAVQRGLREAAEKCELDGLLTPHVLRHCYASHFTGDIQDLQKLMGHVQIETTMGYRHRELERAPNPIDDLVLRGVIRPRVPPPLPGPRLMANVVTL